MGSRKKITGARKKNLPKKTTRKKAVIKTTSSPTLAVNIESVKSTTPALPDQVVPKVYRKIIIGIIAVVIILTVIIVHFSLTKAIIYITPKFTEHDISFSAQIVDPEQSDLDINAQDYLIGHKLNTVVAANQTFPVTEKIVTGDKASGIVAIINNYSNDQTLVKTTRLLTPDEKLFRITETVVVLSGGQIKVMAQADMAGDEYLIEPTSFIIPGLWEGLQDKIYAQSDEPMQYREQKIFELTNDDIDKGYNTLRRQLINKALASFEPNLSASEFINQDALIIDEIRRASSANIGDSVSEFELELELSITTITYDEQKLLAKIENDINVLAEQNQGLINFSDDNIAVTITEQKSDNGIIGLIQGKYKIQLANPNLDINQIKGQDKETALIYLTNISGVKAASIKLQPFWLKKIPTLDSHIEIILNK